MQKVTGWTDRQLDEVLELTQQVRQVILQSNHRVEDGLKTAGELLEEWIDSLPSNVRKELGIQKEI